MLCGEQFLDWPCYVGFRIGLSNDNDIKMNVAQMKFRIWEYIWTNGVDSGRG